MRTDSNHNNTKEKPLPGWIKILVFLVAILFMYSILTRPHIGAPKIPPSKIG